MKVLIFLDFVRYPLVLEVPDSASSGLLSGSGFQNATESIYLPEQDLLLQQILECDAVNGSVPGQRALQNNKYGGMHMGLT